MLEIRNYKFYFCPCTQDLYGDECLQHVHEHAAEVVDYLNACDEVPFQVELKPNLLTASMIQQVFNEANNDPDCAGIITWAHTFSPSKNYILGLQDLKKPLCQFATQYNEEIPYDTIDMDFMNENQAAHGERASWATSLPACAGSTRSSSASGRTRWPSPSSASGRPPRSASSSPATSAAPVSPTPRATQPTR